MYSKNKYKKPTIIGIASGKGGVGKSTVSVNLALALKEAGYKVGVLDADLYGPSLRRMLPEKRLPNVIDGRLSPAKCSGISLISMAYFRKESDAAAVRAPIANRVISQFLNQVEWGEVEVILIDFPPGTGDIQLTLAQQAHLTGALLVTTAQEIALLDVRKAKDLFDQVEIPIIGVIENMSYMKAEPNRDPIYPFGRGGGSKFARECGLPFFGEIPLHPEICQCADEGKSIFSSEVALSAGFPELFCSIATRIMEHVTEKESVKKVQKIEQIDPHRFTIEWMDGVKRIYCFNEIQQNCPCAACALSPKQELQDVEASSIYNVGRYAIRFEFTSGCSYGIYDYDLLYILGKEVRANV